MTRSKDMKLKKYRVYCGPSRVPILAYKLTHHGIEAHEGTSHVYFDSYLDR